MKSLATRGKNLLSSRVTQRRPAMAFIMVTLFLDILGIGLVIPILPKLITQLSGGNVSEGSTAYGMFSALYALMQFFFAPILGSLSDRFGRRKVLLASLFGSGVDYLFLAAAPTLGLLFVGRLIAGITGASITTASAYIADVSPPEKRAQNFGLIGAAFGLGFIAGPAIGGLLGGYNLRLPFLFAAGLTLVNWLYGVFVLPESLAPENRRAFSWARANPIGALKALRRFPVAWRLSGTIFLLNVAQFSLQSTWVLYTDYRFQWTPFQVGMSLAVVGCMAAVVQGGLVRRLVPRFGERKCIVFGLCISTLNMIGYGCATHGWMLYVILCVGSIAAVAGPSAQGFISRSVPANEQGAVQGSISSLVSLGGIIAPPMATGLFGFFISPRAPVHLPGAAFFVGALLIFLAMILALRSFNWSLAPVPVETGSPAA